MMAIVSRVFDHDCLFFAVDEFGQILEIENVVLHPEYKAPNAYRDVAVVTLRASNSKHILSTYSSGEFVSRF